MVDLTEFAHYVTINMYRAFLKFRRPVVDLLGSNSTKLGHDGLFPVPLVYLQHSKIIHVTFQGAGTELTPPKNTKLNYVVRI